MLDLPPNYASVLRLAKETGGTIERIGKTWSHHDLIAISRPGKSLPPIVITAGSHGAEFVGVPAALQLAAELETDHPLTIIPSRDPISVDGYEAALSIASSTAVTVESPDDVARLLRDRGTLLLEDGSFVVGLIGDIATAFDLPTDDDRSREPRKGVGYERILERLGRLLPTSNDILRSLRERRVILPGNFCFDGTSPLRHAHTVIQRSTHWSVFSGFKDLATLFGYPSAPVEVTAVKDLIESVQPQLIFDLHGGYGHGFYMFTPYLSRSDVERRDLAMTIAGAVASAGYPIVSESELEQQTRSFGERFAHAGPGVAMHHYQARHEMLLSFFENYGSVVQLEPPIAASYQDAMSMIRVGVTAGVRSFERGLSLPAQ